MANDRNHGGARPGSGSKPKHVKVALAEKIGNLVTDDKLIKSLVDIALDKTGLNDAKDIMAATKLLLAYGHGTPVQTQNVNAVVDDKRIELDD